MTEYFCGFYDGFILAILILIEIRILIFLTKIPKKKLKRNLKILLKHIK